MQKKNEKKDFDKDLIKRFANTYEFCDGDVNKSNLFLRKGVYPDEYIDDLEKINETSLPNRKEFYRSINVEDTTDVDLKNAGRVFRYFNDQNLSDYHDLYAQSNTLLLADVF